jgi:hypothetical protein
MDIISSMSLNIVVFTCVVVEDLDSFKIIFFYIHNNHINLALQE